MWICEYNLFFSSILFDRDGECILFRMHVSQLLFIQVEEIAKSWNMDCFIYFSSIYIFFNPWSCQRGWLKMHPGIVFKMLCLNSVTKKKKKKFILMHKSYFHFFICHKSSSIFLFSENYINMQGSAFKNLAWLSTPMYFLKQL